jgi:hypothetical protein
MIEIYDIDLYPVTNARDWFRRQYARISVGTLTELKAGISPAEIRRAILRSIETTRANHLRVLEDTISSLRRAVDPVSQVVYQDGPAVDLGDDSLAKSSASISKFRLRLQYKRFSAAVLAELKGGRPAAEIRRAVLASIEAARTIQMRAMDDTIRSLGGAVDQADEAIEGVLKDYPVRTEGPA